MAAPTCAEVEEVVLGLLAEDLGKDPRALRAELAAAGEDLPIDSQLMVEILARIEARFAVRVPETVPTAVAMRSVRRFAEFIVGLIEE
jgi:acyl carrier protein